MKRTQDKIKDFVEPQFFDEVRNFAADPARALAAYRFTDATSDLLARWTDALADLSRGRGAARALAGARGVGKSHTLTVFGALAGTPSLRSQVEDGHVAMSARRLTDRRYTVVRVERGLRATLAEEMAAALAKEFGGSDAQWGTDPAGMLAVAASRAGSATLVVIVDTAFNRPARVRRDDGPQLGELAKATAGVNAFVALALDDDIAGADGANVALAGTYQIDYLDTEHLYRVADQYLLRKNSQARAALHDIYLSLRAGVPGFNWSEPRFASLYPVHPLVADVSAAVRLYASAFAFLPFTARAASRATGRPALSLILLDEVFDVVEADLRKSEELDDAFAAYDHLATKGVSEFPVMQRHQARLVLKSLFILSLDGRGATAAELCAALLMQDESPTSKAAEQVEKILRQFADTSTPGGPQQSIESDGGDEARYRFQINASAAFDIALEESVEGATDARAALDSLRSVAHTRFQDWPLAEVSVEGRGEAADFYLAWRGTERPGRILRQLTEAAADDSHVAQFGRYDWELVILAPGESAFAEYDVNGRAVEDDAERSGVAPLRVEWRPAELSAEEVSDLRRLRALQRDPALQERFGETARAVTSTLLAQAERIWTRVYMNDGALFAGNSPMPFTDAARAARTLGDALAAMLSPLFDERYPEHPRFTEVLGEADAGRLVEAMLWGAQSDAADVGRLARTFAVPLGLATAGDGDECKFGMSDEASARPWCREVLSRIEDAGNRVVPLDAVRAALRRTPHGLLRESQNLLLAALVAARRVEFVRTPDASAGGRTEAQTIDWSEIEGVRAVEAVRTDGGEGYLWASLLTGRPELESVADARSSEAVRDALARWLDDWRKRRIAEAFDAVPDAGLTTRLWKLHAVVRKTFGAAAEALDAALAGRTTLEEGLERVAEAFGNSPETYELAAQHLEGLDGFVHGFARRERERAYLTNAEPTGVDEIERARRELLTIAEDPHALLDGERCERFDLLWREFHARYVEHYAAMHDKTMGAACERGALESLRRGERWREFEALSRLSVVSRHMWTRAQELLKADDGARCDLPVRQLLEAQPACACSFRLARAADSEWLLQEVEQTMERGLNAYRRTLGLLGNHLAIALDALARKEEDADAARRARSLSTAFAGRSMPEHFSRLDVRLVESALGRMAAPPPVRVGVPTGDYGLLTREELRARLVNWLDELPEQPVLIEVVAERE
ncbi:MAG TPA: DUF6079 family protein [Pyrinomonadaceae bacterium]|nr:DUF6079 family protein [Pyrinomonadaceae bacterium]